MEPEPKDQTDHARQVLSHWALAPAAAKIFFF